MLGGPHLVLSHAGDDDSLPARRLGELIDNVLGQQLVGLPYPHRRVFALQLLDVLYPLQVGGGGHLLVELQQDPLQISDDGDVHLDVLPYLRRVDVHVYLLGAQGEGAGFAGNAVVEAHSQGHEQVGLFYGKAGVCHTVHAGHTDAQDVIVGE